MIARALKCSRHPVLAQVVATRRCNLSCAYCTEFDRSSEPVPTRVLLDRVDRLALLGTSETDVTGGEPLLHPELDVVIGRIRQRGMIAGLLTNGYLLTREWIQRLNDAGLDRLQISIDNIEPGRVSPKSLNVIARRLELLVGHAEFDVNINTLIGRAIGRPEDALTIAHWGLARGFSVSLGLVHDAHGQVSMLTEREREIYDELLRLKRTFYSHAHDAVFQRNLARGLPNLWECRAGMRYLYVCEDGLVHWCSQQRGHPATSLDDYGLQELDSNGAAAKPCAAYCTVSCVHRVALLDRLREHPQETVSALVSAHTEAGGKTPAVVTLLVWMLLSGPHQHLARRLASWALRAG